MIDGGVMLFILKKLEVKGFIIIEKDYIDKWVKYVYFMLFGNMVKVKVGDIFV